MCVSIIAKIMAIEHTRKSLGINNYIIIYILYITLDNAYNYIITSLLVVTFNYVMEL